MAHRFAGTARPCQIQSASEEIERYAPAIFAQRERIAQTGERVIIGNKVERFALILERNRWAHHAEVIADVKDASRLNAGKNAHLIPVFLL